MARNAVRFVLIFCLSMVLFSCAANQQAKHEGAAAGGKVRFMILNPGHYHAALVQKSMYEQVDPVVHVYAPDGPEMQEYYERRHFTMSLQIGRLRTCVRPKPALRTTI